MAGLQAVGAEPTVGTNRSVQHEDQLRQGMGQDIQASGYHGLSLLAGGALQSSAVTVPAPAAAGCGLESSG